MMTVKWVTKCDFCEKKWQIQIPLNNKTRYGVIDKRGVVHPYMEIWSPGIPPGWIVMPLEKEGVKFFCSVKCAGKWLRKHGYRELAKDLGAVIPSKKAGLTLQDLI
jgi:hypothetical protein